MPDKFENIDTMGERSDNQYVLALAISKRVRKLRSGAPSMVDCSNSRRKPFGTAMKEISERKITFTLEQENSSKSK